MALDPRPVYAWVPYFEGRNPWTLVDGASNSRCGVSLRRLLTHDFRACHACMRLYHYTQYIYKCAHCLEESRFGP